MWLRVSDLRQHIYCARIPYYYYVAPVERKVSFKMDHGSRVHKETERLERRRKLRRYGLDEGERLFAVRLVSERLRLSGELDMLIRTPHEDVPVEFKLSHRDPGASHRYQLAAYGMLVEEHFGRPVRRGLLVVAPDHQVFTVFLTDGVRRYLRRVLREIRSGVTSQSMPEATRKRGRCRDCEFRLHCHDVLMRGAEDVLFDRGGEADHAEELASQEQAGVRQL